MHQSPKESLALSKNVCTKCVAKSIAESRQGFMQDVLAREEKFLTKARVA